MGRLAEKRNAKRAAKFAVAAASRGGSFETTITPAQILAWLKAARSDVIAESTDSISLHPVFKSGKSGTEVITATTSTGTHLLTLVTITVNVVSEPGNLNLNAIGPLVTLIEKVNESDQSWREA